MSPYEVAFIGNLKSTARKGKRMAEGIATDAVYLDLFIHMLDELERLERHQNDAQRTLP